MNRSRIVNDLEPEMPDANTGVTPELCRLFLAVADNHGSLKAAAEALGAKVSRVSRTLKPLHAGPKDGLPRPWLAKKGHEFRLTDEGNAVLEEARTALAAWDRFLASTRQRREAGLVVACGQESAGGIVLNGAKALRATFPTAGFRVAVVRGRRRIEGVAAGQYDVALVTHTKEEIERIAVREVKIADVRSDELVLACGQGKQPWAADFRRAKGEVAAEELAGWPLVLPEADSPIRVQFDAKAGKANVSPTVALEVGGWRVLLDYVEAEFGIGLLPESIARSAGTAITWRPLDKNLRPSNFLRAVTRAEPDHTELVAAFVSGLR